MDISTFTDEALAKIRSLIDERNYADAMAGCEELLQVSPGEIEALDLYEKARNAVIKENFKKVEQKIKEAKPLWKEERYRELLELYGKLMEYAPEYGKLQKLLKKAHAKAIAQWETGQRKIQESYKETIEREIKAKNWEKARGATKEFTATMQSSEMTDKYRKLVEDRYVENQLEKNRPILNSEKFEEILLIYENLLQHAPWNKKLQKGLAQTQKDFLYHQKDTELRLVKSDTLKIKILYNTKRYEECEQVCNEVLRVNNQNEFAQDFLKKVKKKLLKIRNKKVIEFVKQGFATLKPTYEKDPSAFTII